MSRQDRACALWVMAALSGLSFDIAASIQNDLIGRILGSVMWFIGMFGLYIEVSKAGRR